MSKAFRYGPCVTRGLHSFTCHSYTNHTCLFFSPAARLHRPSAGYSLRLAYPATKVCPGWWHCTVVPCIFYPHILQREICTHFFVFYFPLNLLSQLINLVWLRLTTSIKRICYVMLCYVCEMRVFYVTV